MLFIHFSFFRDSSELNYFLPVTFLFILFLFIYSFSSKTLNLFVNQRKTLVRSNEFLCACYCCCCYYFTFLRYYGILLWSNSNNSTSESVLRIIEHLFHHFSIYHYNRFGFRFDVAGTSSYRIRIWTCCCWHRTGIVVVVVVVVAILEEGSIRTATSAAASSRFVLLLVNAEPL